MSRRARSARACPRLSEKRGPPGPAAGPPRSRSGRRTPGLRQARPPREHPPAAMSVPSRPVEGAVVRRHRRRRAAPGLARDCRDHLPVAHRRATRPPSSTSTLLPALPLRPGLTIVSETRFRSWSTPITQTVTTSPTLTTSCGLFT